MEKDSLGNRMKRYEQTSKYVLNTRTPVILRIDGKAFHTLTRHMERPYDLRLIESMVSAGEQTCCPELRTVVDLLDRMTEEQYNNILFGESTTNNVCDDCDVENPSCNHCVGA